MSNEDRRRGEGLGTMTPPRRGAVGVFGGRLAPVALAALALTTSACGVEDAGVPIGPRIQAASVAPSTPAPSDELGHGVLVRARDPFGRPTVIHGLAPRARAPGGPESAARAHLARLAPLFGVTQSAVDALDVRGVVPVGDHRGAIVRFATTVHDVDVDEGEVRVALDAEGGFVAMRGRLRPLDAVPDESPTIDPEDAVRRAVEALVPRTAFGRVEIARGDGRRTRSFVVQAPDGEVARGTLERVVYEGRDGAEPAYRLELRAHRGSPEAARVRIAGRDGRLLGLESLVRGDAYTYRVFADPTSFRPHDGPTVDVTPYPGGAPDAQRPAFVAASTVTIEGLARPSGVVDPWLRPGATRLDGNHARAYADRADPEGFGAGDVDVPRSAAGRFEYTYDPALSGAENVTQARAAASHAFFVVGYLHDYFYGSGFDENAGNAQRDDFGRGGIPGDAMLVETQNALARGVRDNAFMMAFADGAAPVMQIFLWTENADPALEATGLGPLDAGPAAFGPASFDRNGRLVAALDGVGVSTDGCEALVTDATDRVVLVDRGDCTFEQKVRNAESAGAIAVIVADDQVATAPLRLGDDPSLTDPGIPAVSVTSAVGDSLRLAIANGAVDVHLARELGLERDAALDTQVVAHEWGHYLHLRNASCRYVQCGAVSEGIADFVALHLSFEEGDDPEGAFAVGAYAARSFSESPGYFGVRRMPYSTSPARNALSFRHVMDEEPLPDGPPRVETFPGNAEVHNAGEVVASMLFDGYVHLVEDAGLPFETARRTMADVLVAAVLLAPDHATILETRDAFLLAADLVAEEQVGWLASGFAGRGAGSCAEGPTYDSSDLLGVVEDLGTSGRLRVGEAQLLVTGANCDWDGFLDPGETGVVRWRVANAGLGALTDVDVVLTSSDPALVFPSGTSVRVPSVPPASYVDVEFPVLLAGTAPQRGVYELDLTATAAAECDGSANDHLSVRTSVDASPASGRIDTVETDAFAWFVLGDEGLASFVRRDEPGNVRFWSATAPSHRAERWLVSPTFTRVPGQPLTVRFRYRHDLALDLVNGAFFDAAVLEVSNDGGASFVDVALVGANPYPTDRLVGTLTSSLIGGRRAFGGRNDAYPAWDEAYASIPNLAGSTVRFRIRLASDFGGASGPFELDDFEVGGIVETPFATLVDEDATCIPEPPDAGIPDAGIGGGGTGPGLRSADEGCGCAVAGTRREGARHASRFGWLVLLAVAVRRRRGRGISLGSS